jgi:heme-degrading monooxygenase HmoA
VSVVVLINSFEVPEGKDEMFLAHWNEVANALRREPGFISTALHKSPDLLARFRYVNVAEWASRKEFERATAKVLNEEYLRGNREVAAWSNPALYVVIKH